MKKNKDFSSKKATLAFSLTYVFYDACVTSTICHLNDTTKLAVFKSKKTKVSSANEI